MIFPASAESVAFESCETGASIDSLETVGSVDPLERVAAMDPGGRVAVVDSAETVNSVDFVGLLVRAIERRRRRRRRRYEGSISGRIKRRNSVSEVQVNCLLRNSYESK